MQQFYRNLPVLVTGGAGFIGSHIVHKLVELGAQVTVLDNFSSGFLSNIEDITEKITVLNCSITNPDACLEATKNKKIIFHLAALVSVPESMERPQTCHQVNVDGTFNLLEAARIHGVDRFVFSSSSAVYGTQSKPCSETTPCLPISNYGTSKRIGELLCKQYSNNYNLKTVCLRYFNVFGPRQNPNGAYAAVIAKFTDLMKKNVPLTIFGDGQQIRDFIPVDDVAQANLLLGMQDSSIMNGDACNIATGKGISIIELVEKLKKEFPDYSQKISFLPARQGDITYSVADASFWEQIRQTTSE